MLFSLSFHTHSLSFFLSLEDFALHPQSLYPLSKGFLFLKVVLLLLLVAAVVMSDSSVTVAAVGPSAAAAQPTFTPAQWQELEHQALIFKYLKAGLPVPPYLLLPIRTSFHLDSASFLHHSALGYSSYYGKKIDPEPGRCRRTDGKKWRCSKDAHPDSKYCERHMNRSRNRSRKPVESQTASQSMSTVASEIAASSISGSRTFPNLPLTSAGNSGTVSFERNLPRWQMEAIPYGLVSKAYRSLHGLKPEADERAFLSETLGSTRNFGTNSSVDGTWSLMPRIPSTTISEPRNISPFWQNNYLQLQSLENFEPRTIHAETSKQQQQHYAIGRDFGSLGSGKQENQPLQPLFDEWPKSRDLGSYSIDQRSLEESSTIQLSMATPMASDSFLSGVHSPDDA